MPKIKIQLNKEDENMRTFGTDFIVGDDKAFVFKSEGPIAVKVDTDMRRLPRIGRHVRRAVLRLRGVSYGAFGKYGLTIGKTVDASWDVLQPQIISMFEQIGHLTLRQHVTVEDQSVMSAAA